MKKQKSVLDFLVAISSKISKANIYLADILSDISIAIMKKRIELNMNQSQFPNGRSMKKV
jgi:hypothetical protein